MGKIRVVPSRLPNVVTSGGPNEDKRRSHDGMDGASEDKEGNWYRSSARSVVEERNIETKHGGAGEAGRRPR